jgi:hypothetical protein
MNLSEKGWFGEYLKLKSANFSDSEPEKEAGLYQKLQPSGLMYGHPTMPKELDKPEFLELSQIEKMKLVLLEGFMNAAMIAPIDKAKDAEEFSQYLAESIIQFYEDVAPEAEVKDRNFWGIKLTNEEIAEKILAERLILDAQSENNFWAVFFNNSLLFLDVLFFNEWLAQAKEPSKLVAIKAKREDLKNLLIHLVAAAALADKEIDPEEQELFDEFLKSLKIRAAEGLSIETILQDGIDIDNIDLSVADSWILKKYLLELAILTVWADRVVTEEESIFIAKLAEKLGFEKQELMKSMIAIESFVISNWGSIPFLQEKHNFSTVGDRFVELVSQAVSLDQEDLKKQLAASQEISTLLTKAGDNSLNEDEQKKLRALLIEGLKNLPMFVITSLPGSFLTLPLLLKILPESVLPNNYKEA